MHPDNDSEEGSEFLGMVSGSGVVEVELLDEVERPENDAKERSEFVVVVSDSEESVGVELFGEVKVVVSDSVWVVVDFVIIGVAGDWGGFMSLCGSLDALEMVELVSR